jgi:hypothetical protein
LLCGDIFPNCIACSTLASNNTNCINCNITYYWNATTSICDLCSKAISNCLTCNNGSTCTNCSSNLYYLSNGSCLLCSKGTNCLTCSQKDSCESCVNK